MHATHNISTNMSTTLCPLCCILYGMQHMVKYLLSDFYLQYRKDLTVSKPFIKALSLKYLNL